jgi:hypothetical protein
MTSSLADTPDPRYPIGKYSKPASFDDAWRAAAIAAIEHTPRKLREAVSGLTNAQLDTPYRDGGWTVRQLVHHVADSHVNAYVRTRLALTEENPPVKPYDESKWAELADAKTMPIEPSLAIIDALHARWVHLLKTLSSGAFTRTMYHPEHGTLVLDGMLAIYAWHGPHHTAHVTRLRERNGW